MKQFTRYLRTKSFVLFVLFFFALLFAASFLLYRLPLQAVVYPSLLCMLFGIVFLILKYSHTKKVTQKLNMLSMLNAEMIDELPNADTLCELAYQELISSLQNEVITNKSLSSATYRDMVDYYTVWAHQIKTPISSMKLTLQNEDSEVSRKLRSDLFRTQQYVDMVLAFLRVGADTGDYVFKEYALDSIIRPSIKKFAPEFISRKLSLVYEPIGERFITDEKWFAFLLEQLLSNALKYTNEGGIKIFMAEYDTICVKDTGIGIAPEDLPRIFEKGYTGNNGRTERTASGLGLYLCRRIADNLGLVLSVSSTLGEGTEIRIRFKPQIRH